ncbi:33_t:CDS:1, partial [Dentiscutata heterogama]
MSYPEPHKYEIGTCYGCQKCLFCYENLKQKYCACNLEIKPTQKDTCPDQIIRGQQIHNRSYKVSKTHLAQVNWLKECDKFFGFNTNFNKNFDLTLCSACNSKHDRAKSLYSQSTNNPSNKSELDCETETDDLNELKVKLIIDAKKNSPPEKLLVFTMEEIKDFFLFQS